MIQMNEIETMIKEFEEYLKSKSWKFTRNKFGQNYVYDIEQQETIYIETKEENEKIHVICHEIFNMNYRFRKEFNVKPFFKRYAKLWVSIVPFEGTITEEFEFINKKYPKLELKKRYNSWPGYYDNYAVFSLKSIEEKDKVGYAVIRVGSGFTESNLASISNELFKSFIEYIEAGNTNKRANIIKCGDFYISKSMVQIFVERYISKYPIEMLEHVKAIPDYKGCIIDYLTKDIEKAVNGIIKDNEITINLHYLYDENEKKNLLSVEELNKRYYFLNVVYADDLFAFDTFNYLSENEEIKKHDIVLVNRAGCDVVGLVTEASFYHGYDAPYPVKKTKEIIKKIENEDELKKFGYTYEHFKDYIDKDDKSYWYETYYNIYTFSDSFEIMNNIANKLISEKLAASTHIYTLDSSYWWEGKVETKKEYKLEILTKSSKLTEIKDIIKSMHNYQLPFISYDIDTHMGEELEKWIYDSVE